MIPFGPEMHSNLEAATPRAWLAGFRRHLSAAGLGHVLEIFDSDPAQQPRGCIVPAWGVGELLRAVAAPGLPGTTPLK